jgi:RHS repeat-associated protein
MLNKEYSDKGSPYAEYYIANNQVVSQKMFGLHGLVTPGKEESLKTTGGLMYYQYDRGNTVTELTDRHGDEIEHYRYDAFGNIFTGITSPYNTTGYTGQDYDDVAGLVQMDARWYSPSIGRFTSQDTYMGDMYSSQSLNRYSYVMNNPANMWDPTGHVPEWVGQEVHFIYKSDSQLDDVYVLKSSSSSESGWNLIDTTDNKVNKILKYKATRTYTWNYDHYDFNYTEVKDSETGEISYELKNVTYTLDSFIEKNTYYKEVVVSAAQIASENEQYIKNLAGDPPKNTDPPAYSSSRVNQKFKQVWSSNQVIVNNTGSNSTYAEKQTTGVVQSMLNDIMDRDLEVNKSYGNDTKQSVTDFQKVSNLTANGNLDVKTFNQIMNVYGQYDKYMDILENAGEYRSSYISSIEKKLNELVAPYRDKKISQPAFTPVDNIYDFKDKYGDLIKEYATEMGVDQNVLGAIIFTESSGGGFYENGSLKIRFEDHIFLNSWAGTNGKYSEYFIHSSSDYSLERYKLSLDGEWLQTHIPGNQQLSEYGAFNLALSLDEDAAYNAISMGFGQIMGFNYSAAGYSSAKEMYEDFSKGELQQIQGMMNYINNYDRGSLLQALQDRDYNAFGLGYNNSSGYGSKISNNMKLYGSIN